jgi:hypothetical protein
VVCVRIGEFPRLLGTESPTPLRTVNQVGPSKQLPQLGSNLTVYEECEVQRRDFEFVRDLVRTTMDRKHRVGKDLEIGSELLRNR